MVFSLLTEDTAEKNSCRPDFGVFLCRGQSGRVGGACLARSGRMVSSGVSVSRSMISDGSVRGRRCETVIAPSRQCHNGVVANRQLWSLHFIEAQCVMALWLSPAFCPWMCCSIECAMSAAGRGGLAAMAVACGGVRVVMICGVMAFYQTKLSPTKRNAWVGERCGAVL